MYSDHRPTDDVVTPSILCIILAPDGFPFGAEVVAIDAGEWRIEPDHYHWRFWQPITRERDVE